MRTAFIATALVSIRSRQILICGSFIARPMKWLGLALIDYSKQETRASPAWRIARNAKTFALRGFPQTFKCAFARTTQ